MSTQSCRLISVVIITQDEAERTARAIQSCLPFADEIVVVDGGSKDATVQTAQALGCQVYVNPWPGYAQQRNFGAAKAASDWIFMLDSDETVDADLAQALNAWKQRPADGVYAFRVKRIGNFFDAWLETTSDQLIRLYHRQQISIPEVVVHEEPDPGNLPVGTLTGTIWHYGFRSLHDHVLRFNKYTDLDAQALLKKGRTFSPLRLLARPVARFLQKYLLQRMYRKGMAGLTVALLWSYYEILRELKLYELTWAATKPVVLASANSPEPSI
ncbi:glycosyltransferase family 2 protein [Nodosilinea sp. LEGE 07088]|uniref:glycosyltransferase family 2 protein n=1 Tax=Nodosilinea sp. LEGE 07088 TaxID=2777968 RepID=UPI001880445B|nr:glycosyltransferase family 2 protein [Nodosilinea sp. LEGE 07088]MBE9141552.1 glycosyltransferase family 2 protein [Nodosilinea sp. LEGE 07088]